MKKTSFILLLIFFSGLIFAQQDSIPKQIKYDSNFKFKDGIYLNINQLKNNNPLPLSVVISNLKPDDFGYYDSIFSKEEFSVYDELGNIKKISKKSILGYADKGVLYINYGRDFNRIPVFGQISHFVATVVIEYAAYNPALSNPYYGTNYYPQQTTQKLEMQQFLFDFKTGNIVPFSIKNLKILFSDDPEFYEEFSALSKRKQKKEAFLYIRRYNEKHPVYFPANN